MPVSQVTLHPATVHFPIALLLVGSLAALLYLYGSPRPVLRVMAWGSLRIGWASTGLAILTGLLAQSGLPPQAPYTAVLNWHIGTGFALLVIYGAPIYRAWVFRNRRRAGDPDDLLDVTQARVGDGTAAAGDDGGDHHRLAGRRTCLHLGCECEHAQLTQLSAHN